MLLINMPTVLSCCILSLKILSRSVSFRNSHFFFMDPNIAWNSCLCVWIFRCVSFQYIIVYFNSHKWWIKWNRRGSRLQSSLIGANREERRNIRRGRAFLKGCITSVLLHVFSYSSVSINPGVKLWKESVHYTLSVLFDVFRGL